MKLYVSICLNASLDQSSLPFTCLPPGSAAAQELPPLLCVHALASAQHCATSIAKTFLTALRPPGIPNPFPFQRGFSFPPLFLHWDNFPCPTKQTSDFPKLASTPVLSCGQWLLCVFPKLLKAQQWWQQQKHQEIISSLLSRAGQTIFYRIVSLFHISPFKHFSVFPSARYRRAFAVIFKKAKPVTQVSRHPSQHWRVPAVTVFTAMTHHLEGFFNSNSHCNHTLRPEVLLKKPQNFYSWDFPWALLKYIVKCPESLKGNRHKIMDLNIKMQAHGICVFLIKVKPFYILSFKAFKVYLKKNPGN